MKLLVLSDTHESTFWHTFIQTFDFDQYDKIFHLGDNYSDIYSLPAYDCKDVIAVPGLWRKEYRDTTIENIKYVTISGLHIILSHVEAEGRILYSEEPAIHLFGHTHFAEIIYTGNILKMNPGHLKSKMDRGCIPSYGEIILEGKNIIFYIKNAITNKVMHTYKLTYEKE